MQWQIISLYVVSILLLLVLAAIIAMIVGRRQLVPGAAPLALLALSVALWSFGYARELSSVGLEAALFWARVEYLGIVAAPVAWLLLALQHTGYGRRYPARALAILALIPLTTLALVWTNDRHGLIWSSVAIQQSGELTIFDATYGPWFWVHTAFSYLCMLCGSLLFVRHARRTAHLYRRQDITLLISAVTPWLGNILYVFNRSSLGGLDITPFIFSITIVALTWSLFRFRLLDLIPIAHDAALASMRDGIVILDERMQIVELNPAAQQIVGCEPRDAIGRPVTAVFIHWPALLKQLAGLSLEQDVLADPERQLFYTSHISTLYDHHHNVRGWLIALHDVTETQQTQQALARAKEAAEAATHAKSVFLSHMSHELRTPLTTILGYSQLLQLQVATSKDARMLADVNAIIIAGEHLTSLIDSVLDLSRIEAGRVNLAPERFSVALLLEELAVSSRILFEKNANQLVVKCDDDVGSLFLDRQRLRQVLLNLLSNAAKFTERGTVLLAAERMTDGQTSWIRFLVRDSGIGMSAEQLQTLFQPFTQVHAHAGSRHGGSGLGLAISYQLCQILGGEIEVESQPGSGSTFSIRVPSPHEESAPARR